MRKKEPKENLTLKSFQSAQESIIEELYIPKIFENIKEDEDANSSAESIEENQNKEK